MNNGPRKKPGNKRRTDMSKWLARPAVVPTFNYQQTGVLQLIFSYCSHIYAKIITNKCFRSKRIKILLKGIANTKVINRDQRTFKLTFVQFPHNSLSTMFK